MPKLRTPGPVGSTLGPHGDSQLQPNISLILQTPSMHMTPVSYQSEPSMPGLGGAPCITDDDITWVAEMEKFLAVQKSKMIVSKITHTILSFGHCTMVYFLF